MKRSAWKAFAVALSIVFFISCKKGNDNNQPRNPKVDLLIGSDWKIIKYEVRINSDPFMDRYPTWPACTQDDRFVFRVDNTYEYNEGLTKCNSGDPQVIYASTWSISADGTKITIDGVESTIEQLDANTLIISGNYYTNPDTNYYKVTYSH